MRLLIVRHGETEQNIAGIIQGQIHGDLSEKGKEQARKVAERLKDEKIDYIYSSDLDRAANTAKEIVKFHPDVKIEFVNELRERYFGPFQGKNKKDAGEERMKELKNPHSEIIEGDVKMFERANNFLHQILEKHKDDSVLFVSHGAFMFALIAFIKGGDYKSIKEIEHTQNTGVWIFEIDENKNHKIHISNCIKHLE